MKRYRIFLLPILMYVVISISTTACIPTSNTPAPIVSDSLAIGLYQQTNIINTTLPTTFDGASVEIDNNNTVYILLKQSIPSVEFPPLF